MRKNTHYTVTINGKQFEANTNECLYSIPVYSGPVRLEEVYGKFSRAKEMAWDEWHEFYLNTSNIKCSYEITSHTYSMFTLSMVVYDESNNQYWDLYITPAHYRAVKIMLKK